MNRRSISTVLGVILLAAIVVLLVSVAGVMTVSVSETTLGSAAVHSVGHYDVAIENQAERTLHLQLEDFRSLDSSTDFRIRINGREVYQWDGQTTVEISCLYPGDTITVASTNGDTTNLVREYTVEEPTDCSAYSTFRNKFQYGVVEGTSHQIRAEYDFGLSIVPNGDSVASDNNGDNDMNLGQISLQNDWHHIQRYDEEIEGVEPPVFVIVMVDNVHWTDVPDPSLDPVPSDQYYNWTDDPPSGLDPGSDAYSIEDDGSVDPIDTDETEPTNDIYIVFQPGCDGSEVVFVDESAGYDNQIYLDGTQIIDNTNDDIEGETFSAPAVDCPDGLTWR